MHRVWCENDRKLCDTNRIWIEKEREIEWEWVNRIVFSVALLLFWISLRSVVFVACLSSVLSSFRLCVERLLLLFRCLSIKMVSNHVIDIVHAPYGVSRMSVQWCSLVLFVFCVRSAFIPVQHGQSKVLAVATFATTQTVAEDDDGDKDDKEDYIRRISSVVSAH